MKDSSKKKPFLIYIAIIIVISIVIYDLLSPDSSLSIVILGITAMIILWYTWETHIIRQAESIIAETSKEVQNRVIQPVVGYRLFSNEQNPIDIGFDIRNNSEYPVAARVKFCCKLGDEVIKNIWPAYDGKEYWNLQYRQLKYGHFNWLDLYSKSGLLPNEDVKKLKSSSLEVVKQKISEELNNKYKYIPKLTINIEVYCENDLEQTTYYPPSSYELNLNRFAIIAQLTSDKPFWEYDSKPIWIN